MIFNLLSVCYFLLTFFHFASSTKVTKVTTYQCNGTPQLLENVFGEFGPLCDGIMDCWDNSDETECDNGAFNGNNLSLQD